MNHHVPEDLLASYAAGGLDEGEALLVATHLALCPRCRAACDGLDSLGGEIFSRTRGASEVPLPEGSLDALLSRLDAPEPPRRAMPPAAPGDLPMPLRAWTGPLADVPFRRTTPGIWRFDLPQSTPNRPVALVSIRPKLVVPPHRHSATERGLVLRGGFTDELGHYVRGDVSLRSPDDDHVHQQTIDDGERCVLLMVDDGPKIPTTLWGRAVNFLFDL